MHMINVMVLLYHRPHYRTSVLFYFYAIHLPPVEEGEFLLYYVKITLISSFVNMSVRVIFAAVLVFHFSLQIEALPFSYLAGWIGMLLAEVPLLLRKF